MRPETALVDASERLETRVYAFAMLEHLKQRFAAAQRFIRLDLLTEDVTGVLR